MRSEASLMYLAIQGLYASTWVHEDSKATDMPGWLPLDIVSLRHDMKEAGAIPTVRNERAP